MEKRVSQAVLVAHTANTAKAKNHEKNANMEVITVKYGKIVKRLIEKALIPSKIYKTTSYTMIYM